LKYIPNETINHFKKFISRLHKKEEEALLNKKKKREEVKQKNKYEKNKMNNLNNPNPYNYYPGMYMPPMQINNQNPAYYNEYQNYYYLNPPSYQMGQQMIGPPYYSPFIMPQNTLEDSLNMIYNRGIVNNIIGAFFIKEYQDRQRQRQSEKRTVPISTVELYEQGENENNHENNNTNNNNNNEINDESNNKLSYMVNDFKLKNENEENNNKEKEEENNSKKNEDEKEEKKVEVEQKEENSVHNENELKKPSMV